ncbi:MAG: hypothetical protein AAGJ46_14065 [Planctomycetota bacterium]
MLVGRKPSVAELVRGVLLRGVAVALSCSAAIISSGVANAQPNDPDLRFVERLRERGDFEEALDYLSLIEQGGVATPALRGRLPYELAVTRLGSAGSLVDATRREQAVAQAQRDLEAFIRSTDDQALVADGSSQLAAALAAQGFQLVTRAEKLTGDDKKAEKKRLLEDARKTYESARQLYKKSEAAYLAALEAYKVVKPGSAEATARLSLRRRLAGARVRGSATLYDKAKAYPAGSKTFKELNTTAAEELLEHYDRYVDDPIGLYAHLYEGWCYQALEDHKLAKGCFEAIVIRDARIDAYRDVITLAHAFLAKSRIATGEVDRALRDGEKWLGELRRDESRTTGAAALQYQLAEAVLAKAETDAGADRRELVAARDWLRAASRTPNQFQSDARAKLVTLTEKLGVELTAPTTFAGAYQAGREAISAMTAATLVGDQGSSDAVAGARDDARQAFLSALRLVDDDTEPARINEVRYWLAYLHWEAKEYLETAAISEFVARNYPDDPMAERAATLALASLEKLSVEDTDNEAGDEAPFAVRRLRSVATFVTKRWAGQTVADSAFSVLMALALRSGDLSDAQQVLSQLPEKRRPALAVKLASAKWEQANRQAIEAGSDPQAQAAAQQAKNDARAMLEEFLPAASKERPVSASVATASLYLSLAWLGDGKAGKAVKQLEDDEVGAITLVRKKSPAADRPGFAIEAYKAALRGYVTVSPSRTDDAIKTMDRLEKAVGGDDQTLTRVYFGLGLQLQRQIEQLREAGATARAERLAGAFAVFLERLSERSGDADWRTQQWIGQTLLGLSEGLGSSGTSEGQQRRYAEQAAAVFDNMLQRAAADPSLAPSDDALLAVRVQSAKALGVTGEYERSLDQLADILTDRNVLLSVQKTAAEVLQGWGAQEPDRLVEAIGGARPDPATSKNVIWGWSRLGRVAGQVSRRNPEYKDLFFECWLNVAACRYLAAEQASGRAREDNLQRARKTIRSIRTQYQEMGGPARRADFDRLLKQVQQLEGAEPVGLAEFES